MTAPTLLYVQIAHGYNVEFRIFERLTQYAGNALRPHVLYNAFDPEKDDTARFERLTLRPDVPCMIHPIDFGWRPLHPPADVWTRYANRTRYALSFARAVREARRIAPQVIVSSQQYWDCVVATAIARHLNLPQIIYLHYNVGDYLRPFVLKRLRTCEQIVTVSEFIRQDVIRHGAAPERVRVILNPVDPVPTPPPGTRARIREELGVPETAILLGNVARLDPQKGQADILQAFAQILPQFPDTRLVIVGTDSPWHAGYGDTLRELAKSLGVAHRTIFTGYRTNIPELLAGMDIFLHPSKKEPFGQATAEASQAGLPVIAYSDGGTKEIVQNGVSGLLTDYDSGFVGIADAITTLLKDADLRKQLGAAGRERMALPPFAPQSGATAFVETVQGVLGERRGGQVKVPVRTVTEGNTR